MRMKRLRLYLDTTVWNFAFAEDASDYRHATLDFFERVHLFPLLLAPPLEVLDEAD